MNQRLRVIEAGEDVSDGVTMAEAAQHVVKRIVAARPSVMLVLWQQPGGEIEMCSLPGSESLARGMVCDAYSKLFPQDAANLAR